MSKFNSEQSTIFPNAALNRKVDKVKSLVGRATAEDKGQALLDCTWDFTVSHMNSKPKKPSDEQKDEVSEITKLILESDKQCEIPMGYKKQALSRATKIGAEAAANVLRDDISLHKALDSKLVNLYSKTAPLIWDDTPSLVKATYYANEKPNQKQVIKLIKGNLIAAIKSDPKAMESFKSNSDEFVDKLVGHIKTTVVKKTKNMDSIQLDKEINKIVNGSVKAACSEHKQPSEDLLKQARKEVEKSSQAASKSSPNAVIISNKPTVTRDGRG